MNPDAYREHRYLHNTVYDWCVASLQIPGLEPDRRARIEEIRREPSLRRIALRLTDRMARDADRIRDNWAEDPPAEDVHAVLNA